MQIASNQFPSGFSLVVSKAQHSLVQLVLHGVRDRLLHLVGVLCPCRTLREAGRGLVRRVWLTQILPDARRSDQARSWPHCLRAHVYIAHVRLKSPYESVGHDAPYIRRVLSKPTGGTDGKRRGAG